MANITAADVNKLRKKTGAGMMDCKKALTQADGDFDKAIEIIREKGQAVAQKRSDREASEGVVFSKVTEDARKGFIISLNCETDFVAKNDDFIKLANQIIDLALDKQPNDKDELLNLELNGKSVSETIKYQTGIIGEKLELSYYDFMEAARVTPYIHMDNKLATLIGLNKDNIDQQVGKDVAMQVAAMNPIAVTRDGVDATLVEKELEIAKEQLINEGKPEEIAEKAAKGKLRRFYEERVLLEQKFVKDNGVSVKEYLEQNNAPMATSFHRIQLGES